jgi:hypothetical protein
MVLSAYLSMRLDVVKLEKIGIRQSYSPEQPSLASIMASLGLHFAGGGSTSEADRYDESNNRPHYNDA